MGLRRFNSSLWRRHDPFSGFFKDNFFDNPDFEDRFSPATNLQTLDDRYEIQLALPGYDKEDISIRIDNNVLTIAAEEVKETELTEIFTRREFYKSEFTRSFSLPEDVNENKISARMENGILHISIGRHDHDPKVRSKTISIK